MPEIQILINGEPRTLPPGTATVAALLCELGHADGHGIAVALNREVVPRGEWAATPLRPGDDLEILAATQGG